MFLRSFGITSDEGPGFLQTFRCAQLIQSALAKTGRISGELSDTYRWLFDHRQKADYEDLIRFTTEDVKPWIEKTEEFLEAIEELINESQ